MKAGARTRRTVGQAYEFPENHRGVRRRAVAALGGLTSLMTLMVLPGIAMVGVVAYLPDLFVLALLGALTVRVATSWPSVMVEEHFLRLRGELVEAYRVQALDVFVPKGRPGSKAYPMRLVFTVTEPVGPVQTEIGVRARADQARRLLSEVRRVLPHGCVCDRSGLLEPLREGEVVLERGQGQSPPSWQAVSPRAPAELRIVPDHTTTGRPRWAPDPRASRDARRGARHQERLALATPRTGEGVQGPSCRIGVGLGEGGGADGNRECARIRMSSQVFDEGCTSKPDKDSVSSREHT